MVANVLAAETGMDRTRIRPPSWWNLTSDYRFTSPTVMSRSPPKWWLDNVPDDCLYHTDSEAFPKSNSTEKTTPSDMEHTVKELKTPRG